MVNVLLASSPSPSSSEAARGHRHQQLLATIKHVLKEAGPGHQGLPPDHLFILGRSVDGPQGPSKSRDLEH